MGVLRMCVCCVCVGVCLCVCVGMCVCWCVCNCVCKSASFTLSESGTVELDIRRTIWKTPNLKRQLEKKSEFWVTPVFSV